MADKQWPAQLALESFDRRGKAGLRNQQPLGRAGERALIGHGEEVLKLADLALVAAGANADETKKTEEKRS